MIHVDGQILPLWIELVSSYRHLFFFYAELSQLVNPATYVPHKHDGGIIHSLNSQQETNKRISQTPCEHPVSASMNDVCTYRQTARTPAPTSPHRLTNPAQPQD